MVTNSQDDKKATFKLLDFTTVQAHGLTIWTKTTFKRSVPTFTMAFTNNYGGKEYANGYRILLRAKNLKWYKVATNTKRFSPEEEEVSIWFTLAEAYKIWVLLNKLYGKGVQNDQVS